METTVYFLFPLTWQCVNSVCGGSQGNACCAGSYWNTEKSSCEKCPIGYHSINCSEICKSPSYGEDCQGTCICNDDLCDHRFGCKKLNADVTSTDTTSSQSLESRRDVETTPLSTKSTFTDKPPVGPNLPYTIMYIAIAFVGIIVILCGLFVGIYFYKHCMKQVVIVERKGGVAVPGGYSSLGVDIHLQSDHSRDLTYLEPVSGQTAQYDEIKEQDEIHEIESFNNATNETKNIAPSDVPFNLPHSESFPFPSIVNKNLSDHTKRKFFSTNSL